MELSLSEKRNLMITIFSKTLHIGARTMRLGSMLLALFLLQETGKAQLCPPIGVDPQISVGSANRGKVGEACGSCPRHFYLVSRFETVSTNTDAYYYPPEDSQSTNFHNYYNAHITEYAKPVIDGCSPVAQSSSRQYTYTRKKRVTQKISDGSVSSSEDYISINDDGDEIINTFPSGYVGSEWVPSPLSYTYPNECANTGTIGYCNPQHSISPERLQQADILLA